MLVTIVTCFESNEERARFVYEACLSRGYAAKVITTDFSHMRKVRRDNIPADFEAVSARAYQKNMSLSRLLSHRRFAKDAFRLIEKQDPDLLWVIAPANSLIKEANIYKKKHPHTKIIIDIIDMWPESLPVSFNKDILPFRIWRNVRRNHIGCADHLVSECDLYQEILKEEYEGPISTIRWARDSKAPVASEVPSDEVFSLCYIGSINNIIAADKIAAIISSLERKTIVHVIGEGENTASFLNTLKEVCEVIYHGPIRDEKKKAEIFGKCHAGINIYKDGLYIGLTVKCIDYLEHGLPLISNIRGDTWKLVADEGIGVNVGDDLQIDADKIIALRKHNEHIREVYNKYFTKEVFVAACLKVIDEVCG